jgi:hypothetical protein
MFGGFSVFSKESCLFRCEWTYVGLEETCLHHDSYKLLNIFITFIALLQLRSRTSALIPVIFISEKKTVIVSANASYRIC